MLRDQRLRDFALVLPVLAILLFLPAVLGLVSGHRWFAGLPSLPVFIFAAWIGLIAAAAWLARGLTRMPEDSREPDKPA